jgi:hypothetical protein
LNDIDTTLIPEWTLGTNIDESCPYLFSRSIPIGGEALVGIYRISNGYDIQISAFARTSELFPTSIGAFATIEEALIAAINECKEWSLDLDQ